MPLSRIRFRCPDFGLRFSKHSGFEFLECCSHLFQVGTGIDLHADSDSVAPLVGGNLRIDTGGKISEIGYSPVSGRSACRIGKARGVVVTGAQIFDLLWRTGCLVRTQL